MPKSENQTVLKRRKNRRIRICGGCSSGFKDDKFCFCVKQERFLRGEKMPDGKKKLVPVHFHLNKWCLRKAEGFSLTDVVYDDNDLTDNDFEDFRQLGLDLSHLKK